jgi:uncharacterized protein YaaQ
MKVVWAVVQNEDAGGALKALVAKGYRTTRIDTVGGLFKRGNVTLLTGVEAEHVDEVVATLRENCQARAAGGNSPQPTSRAVVFVLDAPGFMQV